jgi:type 1 fimbria pilin
MRVLFGTMMIAALAANAASAAPGGVASYDGKWSVEVITDKGTCDRVYRWSIGIQSGRVMDTGEIARPSGGVSATGKVTMKFVRNNDYASATGQISGEWGTGSWSSPTLACSGRWRAERRG